MPCQIRASSHHPPFQAALQTIIAQALLVYAHPNTTTLPSLPAMHPGAAGTRTPYINVRLPSRPAMHAGAAGDRQLHLAAGRGILRRAPPCRAAVLGGHLYCAHHAPITQWGICRDLHRRWEAHRCAVWCVAYSLLPFFH
eukprot:1159682-Pelagomonas_calceolata.AAC.9